MTIPPGFRALRCFCSAAGFIAISTSGASPGVWMSWSEKWSWKELTPARVPAGARISAGKSGRVARSLPASAVWVVNRSPVSCMPSPESPANRTTALDSWIRSRSVVLLSLIALPAGHARPSTTAWRPTRTLVPDRVPPSGWDERGARAPPTNVPCPTGAVGREASAADATQQRVGVDRATTTGMPLEVDVLGAGGGVAGGTVGGDLLSRTHPGPVRNGVAVEVQVPEVVTVVGAQDRPEARAVPGALDAPDPARDGPDRDPERSHDVGPAVRTSTRARVPPGVDEGTGLVEWTGPPTRARRRRGGAAARRRGRRGRCGRRRCSLAGPAFRGQPLPPLPLRALTLPALTFETILLRLLLGLQVPDEFAEGREAALEVGGDLLLLRSGALELLALGLETRFRGVHPRPRCGQVLGPRPVGDHGALHGLRPRERGVGILAGQEHRQRVEVGAVFEHRTQTVGHQFVELAQLRAETGDLELELFSLALQFRYAGHQPLVRAVRVRDVRLDRFPLLLGLGQIALDLREVTCLRHARELHEQHGRQQRRQYPQDGLTVEVSTHRTLGGERRSAGRAVADDSCWRGSAGAGGNRSVSLGAGGPGGGHTV